LFCGQSIEISGITLSSNHDFVVVEASGLLLLGLSTKVDLFDDLSVAEGFGLLLAGERKRETVYSGTATLAHAVLISRDRLELLTNLSSLEREDDPVEAQVEALLLLFGV